jgi:uncharacterized protein
MSIARSLFELQNTDNEIQSIEAEVSAINEKLVKSEKMVIAEEHLHTVKENLLKITLNRKEVEGEVDELEKNIKQISGKLYSGTVKNPKELLGFEQEIKILKEKLGQQEDLLMNLLNEEEKLQQVVKEASLSVENIKLEWNSELPELKKRSVQIDDILHNLAETREIIVSEMDVPSLKLYDTIRQRKGLAVVKIEQGRCQKCRISLSVNELQKAKSGSLLQCSNCGLILYLG